jgi:hypothetical protein
VGLLTRNVSRRAATSAGSGGLVGEASGIGEDDLKDSSQIALQVMRKKNSTRSDPPWTSYVKQCTRHYIETVFSNITRVFPKSIHAVTLDGFLLKLSAFIFAFTLKTAFID